MPNGTVVYDPRHRVTPKKEYAVKRRRSREALAHIVHILPLLPEHLRNHGKDVLIEYAKHSNLYKPGPRKLRKEDLENIYKLLSKIKPGDNTLLKKAKNFFLEVENSLCRTKTKPWTAIISVQPDQIQPIVPRSSSKKTILIPAWGCHITWVKNEKPLYPKFWNKHQGKSINFKINPTPNRSPRGHHFFFIESDQISTMREELGLNPKPPVRLHLTYGREV